MDHLQALALCGGSSHAEQRKDNELSSKAFFAELAVKNQGVEWNPLQNESEGQ